MTTLDSPPLKPAIRLTRWRRRHRLTQEAAAVRLGMSVRTLQAWEQGQRVPRGFTLIALLEKLNT